MAVFLTSMNFYIVYSVFTQNDSAKAMQAQASLKESVELLEQAKINIAKNAK